jgi:hypothetical protein
MERSKGEPKLIYQAMSNEHYFGMPDNNVYVIYSNHYKNPDGKTGFEFIIAVLEEFSYNYEKETLLAYKDDDIWSLTMKEAVCGWTQKMNILKTYKMAETRLSPVKAKAIMNKFFVSKTKQ